MDSGRKMDPRAFWTNEKHLRFLNFMEASFVKTMFETNGHHLPLDRYVPDSSESTQDLKIHRRKKHVTSAGVLKSRSRHDSMTDRKTRRLSSQPYNHSQDQVGGAINIHLQLHHITSNTKAFTIVWLGWYVGSEYNVQ
ncbi:hypothetical protein L1049_020004 [Liquidambar formosana]|uniref:Uncharacterized protein n=1 Tax=Liquidambar formosana TaxID=63359 RepID=A0AAP0S6T4_LIQFO